MLEVKTLSFHISPVKKNVAFGGNSKSFYLAQETYALKSGPGAFLNVLGWSDWPKILAPLYQDSCEMARFLRYKISEFSPAEHFWISFN